MNMASEMVVMRGGGCSVGWGLVGFTFSRPQVRVRACVHVYLEFARVLSLTIAGMERQLRMKS